uniref:Putative reverse transcriptase domain-containing protein n=1 Tax=Tanacetum cinerariifolium TaxID=118510 RepID=A0A699GGU4_TANCI|nr:putative reverse transcriptase domain-containing protein [Tanacetum cinerariifolium]
MDRDKILWTPVRAQDCNNWQLCDVFLIWYITQGETGGRASRGGGRTRGHYGGQGDGRNDGSVGQVGGQGSEVNGGVDGVPDFSTITAQQLQNLLPTIVAQVGDHDRETELWNHAMVEVGHAAYSDRFCELAGLVPHLVTLEVVQLAGTLTNETLRNGSIKKNPEKRGNRGEPSKDRNGLDDNKRTRTGNSFATITNPVRGGYTGTSPKCTACSYHHLPKTPCRNCFNCNCFGQFAKDCRVVPRKAESGSEARGNHHYATTLFDFDADYSFVSTTFIPFLDIEPSDLGFSYEIKIASGQLVKIDKVIRGCKLEIKVRIPLLDGKVLRVLGENPEEKMRHVINGDGIHVDPREYTSTLKDKLCNAHVLALLDGPKDFVVYCDASGLGLGCVLMQRGKVIAYVSREIDEMIELRSDEALYYLDRIWVPLKGDVKAKHQRPSDLLQQLEISEWKWEGIAIDFVTQFPRTSSGKCHSLIMWAKVEEGHLIGPELVQETTEKILQIKDRLKVTHDHQKSYADKRRKPLKFSIGDYVLLKVSAWKGMVRFRKKEKLAPRFVRPFEIVEKVDTVAYRLDFLEEINDVYDTFHMSNLKKCLADPTLQVPLDEIQIDARVAAQRTLVRAGDKTNGDARSWYMISGDANSWVSFGKILEEIHVTWAHLEKKRTRLQLFTKSDEENAYSGWRRRQNTILHTNILGYSPRSKTEFEPSEANPEESEGEDASEEDSLDDDTSQIAEPLSIQATPAPPTLPHRPAILA